MSSRQITQKFKLQKREYEVDDALLEVFIALEEAGYEPIDQIVGYLSTGDLSYITNNKNARTIIQQLDKEEILDELVSKYIDNTI